MHLMRAPMYGLVLVFSAALTGCGRDSGQTAGPGQASPPGRTAVPGQAAAPRLIHSPPIAKMGAEQLIPVDGVREICAR